MIDAMRTGTGRRFTRIAVAAACLVLSGLASETVAQSAICRQIEAELANLGRSSGAQAGQYSQQSGAARRRLGQVQGTMASLGCNQGFVLFGPQPPAQCGALRAQAASLQATIAQYDGASRQASAGNPQRRAQLMAALSSNGCRGAPPPQVVTQPRQPRGFFETLFGVQDDRRPGYATETMTAMPDQPVDPDKLQDKRVGRGGPLAVCVRTCDGFFFPVNYQGADGQFEEVCQASCPASDAQLYWMAAGGDLDTARSEDGKPYTALPAAFKYRQSYDPSCSCKAKEQTWGSVLKEAERLVRDRKTDITVTKERSDEMARPKTAGGLRGVKGAQTAAAPANVAADGQPVAENAPAAETEANGKPKVRNVAPALTTAQ